ncbi:uncharacterized protein K452DRAFT_356932 [Aplosporella prunicola CBS 121167]|uniref:Amino acid permease/ SLC12A domain-containing protein n=1 Tax=Aplosporella prunicola CBS 121167 TaxID=1176127 RepID=A0A6A6BIJ2_9PEZI|nr:uncharacterized protein K452DRAFT_356932 [Aplosporella prunicola CBS 121167]KAF2143960.1 hypothetical protein K452DRAFT_356932 [Aplosporella prunicola CBS 121167]
MSSAYDYEKKKDLENDLAPTTSIQQAHAEVINDDEHGQFHRSFTPRQIHVISLGSNIGSGIFIGLGQSLSSGGPGNMIIAYILVCTCVWAVLQTLSEMTIAFPTSGNYIDYAGRWVDPSLAFGAGLAEWIGWTAIVASEAAFFNILIQYWAEYSLHEAVPLTIFLVVMVAIFIMPNTVFAWFEYFTSILKITLLLFIIILGIVLCCGAGPKGMVHDGAYWKDLPVFKNGFSGFAECALLAVWAVGDQVFIGIMGGEAESPRYSMAHATKLVPFRVNFVFLSTVLLVTFLIPSSDDRLLGGSGVTASPFIIAAKDAGVPQVSHILNAGMMVSIMGNGAEAVYIASRVLRTMAHQKVIPEYMAQVDSQGRPRRALIFTTAIAIALTYANLSASGSETLTWLIAITSSAYFINWMIIAYTSWRFRASIKAQNDGLFSEPYAWKSTWWPLAPAWLMTVCMLLLVCCFVRAIKPPGSPTTVENFFQYMLGILIIVVFTAAYKLIYRNPSPKPKTADNETGRRPLGIDELTHLDEYYKIPKYRRALGYLQLW